MLGQSVTCDRKIYTEGRKKHAPARRVFRIETEYRGGYLLRAQI